MFGNINHNTGTHHTYFLDLRTSKLVIFGFSKLLLLIIRYMFLFQIVNLVLGY